MSAERAVDLHAGWAQALGRARPRIHLQAWLPCLVVALLAAAAAAAGALAPFAPAKAHLADALTAPQWLGGRYVLGTDQLGRDVLSRLLFGLRTSLEVGAGAVVISAIVGIPLGLLAGYAGSWTDWVIMRLVDFQMSIPGILLLLVLAFLIGPGLRTTIVILGFASWLPYARMARAETAVVNSQAFVLAARAVGCRPLRVALRHTLPNIVSSLVVLATLQFGQAIILEASISFLGFGVRSPDSSLGIMISDGRSFLAVAWWLLVWPGAVIFIAVLSLNLAGDAVQDWIDPSRRRR